MDASRPRRVFMTADAVGGVWTYAIELSRALQARGVTVEIATMGPPPRADQLREANEAGVTVVSRPYRLEWSDRPWSDVDAAAGWLMQEAALFGADLIHLNGYAHAALPWAAPVVVVGHSCVLSWWEAVKGTAAPPAWDEYRRRVRLGLRAADHVVTPSRAMLEALVRHYGHFGAASVVANGRSAEMFQPARPEPFILAAGRFWDEAKNMRAVDVAAADVPWLVLLAGEMRGPGGDVVKPASARSLGLLPSRGLAAWMSRASIFVSPARYEPFGLGPLEAALAGCTLVLGDIPSLREIWNDAAVFVPPDDSRGLAAALGALIDEPSRRRLLATLARRRALALTPRHMAEGYLAVYAQASAAFNAHAQPEALEVAQ
jgi:glycogen(starch) synthase